MFSDAILKQYHLTTENRKEGNEIKGAVLGFFPKSALIRIQFLPSGQGKGLSLFSNVSWQAAN